MARFDLPNWPVLDICSEVNIKSPGAPRVLESKLTFVQNDLVAEDHDIEFSIGNDAIQDVAAWFAAGFDVEGANADNTPLCRFR